jgi:tRNA (adenine-N(1)-)-methyltransferase non-catalytic subunit
MRIDTLSQFLVLGNVFSHTQALVFETCSGLIVSAVLERMGPRGHIIRVAQDNNFNTHTHIVQLINQPTTEVRDSMITSIPFSFFGRAKQPVESRSELKDEKLQRFNQFEATLTGKSKSMMCDSMLIATNSMDHHELFTQFWPLLQPSGTFAIYSSFREPLQLIYSQLRTDKTAVLLQLSETWMREFQVLPHRTHPHMKTSSASGYILSGIKVINS